MAYAVVDPSSGVLVREFAEATAADVEDALSRSAAAFPRWRREPASARAEMLDRVAALYAERADELADLVVQEMGKPVTQARIEIDIVVSIYRYYADHASVLLADEPLDVVAGGRAVVRRQPLGAVLGVMPWNFPYYQVARFAAPNLLLGNTVVLKPAPQCPQSALAMDRIFAEAGLVDGAYVTLFATDEQVATVIGDQRTAGVSVTGSERAGAAVAAAAGLSLKKVVLELGGSDPFVVTPPVDLDRAVRHAVQGRLVNGGQACNAAKRIIVVDEIFDDFVEKFVEAFAAVVPGDPTDPATALGPLSSERAAETLSEQVDDAVTHGATVLVEGGRVDRAGAWFRPVALTDVGREMRAYGEELFGPVAVIYRAESEDHAIELANDSAFGLGAVVQCDDLDRAMELADRLETGMVYVNEPPGTAAELPFGGVKRSGTGRELGKYGLDEFANKKLIRLGD